MTDKTSTWDLTRTTATDDPRRMADYIKALAVDADQRMAGQFRDLARAVTPPFAVLRLNTPVDVDFQAMAPGAPANGAVPFDTVDADTGGLVDLSSDPYRITLTETGYWWGGGYALTNGYAGASNSGVEVSARIFGTDMDDTRHDGLLGNFGAGLSGVEKVTTISQFNFAFLTVQLAGSFTRTTTTVFFAELWAIKLRDL